jgi:hypothetical protein
MGRPLNKKYFGTPTDAGSQIKVQYHNGSSSVNGWIVKQKGAKRFECTDGTTPQICVLADKASAAIAAGEMTITINDGGVARQVIKIAGKKVTLDSGTTINWDFTGTGGVVEIEDAGGAVINATAAVDGTAYEIITAGTTDYTGFGSSDRTVGTVFTLANAPATGTGTVRVTAETADDFENDDATT